MIYYLYYLLFIDDLCCGKDGKSVGAKWKSYRTDIKRTKRPLSEPTETRTGDVLRII